jgi:hypothetical protein
MTATAAIMLGPEESRAGKIQPYLDKFMEWAVASAKAAGNRSGQFVNSEALREWDLKHNFRRIEKSFGSAADIREAGIRALYTRVLGNYLRVEMASTSRGVSADPSYSSDVEMSRSIHRIYIPEANAEEREILIQEQEDAIRRAAKRLAYYKMPLERLIALFRELEQEARA